MAERIGFIGLGIMGKPMARNLIRAGYSLTVHNRTRAAEADLVALGATAAATPREVAAASDIVLIMAPDSPDVEQIISGPQGIRDAARPGLLVVDCSTISPVVTRQMAEQLRERGAAMLDAPVSGGDKGAIEGTLSIMVGGAPADFARAEPIFAAMGKTTTYCGPVGAGQTVKVCNQIVVAVVLEAISEALVLGSKAGADPEIILRVLSGGMAQTRAMDLRGATMIQHRFTPGFKARLHQKDLGIVLETAKAYGVTLPATALVNQFFTALVAEGRGEWDHSALLTIIERLSSHALVATEPSA